MIQDAFRGAYFDTPGALFGVLNNKGAVVRPGTTPPDGFVDYTSALVDALAVLRKAPEPGAYSSGTGCQRGCTSRSNTPSAGRSSSS